MINMLKICSRSSPTWRGWTFTGRTCCGPDFARAFGDLKLSNLEWSKSSIAVMMAIAKGHQEIVNLLYNISDNRQDILLECAKLGKPEMIHPNCESQERFCGSRGPRSKLVAARESCWNCNAASAFEKCIKEYDDMREREEEATPHPSYKYKKREVNTNNAVCPSGINESLYAFNYVSSTRLAKASEDNDLLENLGTYNQGFS